MNRRMILKAARMPMFRASRKFDKMIMDFVRAIEPEVRALRCAMLDIISNRFE